MTSADQVATAESALSGMMTARGVTRVLGPIAVGIAMASALVTFLIVANLTPIAPTNQVVWSLYGVTGFATLLLVGLIVREVWFLIQARRRGRAAARLHVRIVALFSVIAAAPAV